jgi:hypothetical protein
MDDKTLGYCVSLQFQLVEIWLKLGGKYGEWNASRVFDILLSKRVLSKQVDSWDDTTKAERMGAIGVMRAMLAAYNRQWEKTHSVEAERQAHKRDVLEGCMTREQAREYLAQHHVFRIMPEIFDLVDTFNGVQYYRLREVPQTLFPLDRAKVEWSLKYWFSDHEFPNPMFEEVHIPWWHQPVYRYVGTH